MPNYAYLENEDLPCPNCNASLRVEAMPSTHHVKFSWGYCPARFSDEVIYRVGDAIRWWAGNDGVVRGWTSFAGESFNVGDPSICDLTVTDERGELSQLPAWCPRCGKPIGGAAIEIRAGLIESVWVFRPGERAHGAYYLLQEDGSRLRMPPWEGKASEYIES